MTTRLLSRILLLVLTAVLPFQIRELQDGPVIRGDTLDAAEERLVKETAGWLAGYMKERKLKNLYIPDELYTDRILRRVWMYLPGHLHYRILVRLTDGARALDPGIFKFEQPLEDGAGIFMTVRNIIKFDDLFRFQQIHELPGLSFQVYLIEVL